MTGTTAGIEGAGARAGDFVFCLLLPWGWGPAARAVFVHTVWARHVL